jgi:hypothetical protein
MPRMSAHAQMFDEIDRMDADAWASHVLERWDHDRATIVEATVTYTRTDDRQVSVPVVTIYRTDGGDQIADYRVYIDLAPVFAPAEQS